jgi:hypothetical protein
MQRLPHRVAAAAVSIAIETCGRSASADGASFCFSDRVSGQGAGTNGRGLPTRQDRRKLEPNLELSKVQLLEEQVKRYNSHSGVAKIARSLQSFTPVCHFGWEAGG